MVMMIEPLQACLAAVRQDDPMPAPVIYLTPQGVPLTQAKVRQLAALPRMVLLCLEAWHRRDYPTFLAERVLPAAHRFEWAVK